VTPEEARDFYEDDEDPAAVFARFDAGPHVVTARPGYSAIEQVRHALDYIRSTYGEAGDAQ
jgi:hypothetical protein